MACRCCSGRGSGNWAVLGSAISVVVLMPAIIAGSNKGGASAEETPVRQVTPSAAPDRHPADVLHHRATLIDGTPQELGAYRGKVVLIVNTASECGLTPQYEALEALYREKKDLGLVVLGFPANDFKGQEPGTNEQIATFCTQEFGVTFPMFEKIEVTGENKHPLYEQLAELPEPIGGEPAWNFTKFLVDRRGRVVERFEPKTTPDDPRVTGAIDRLLSQKAGAPSGG